MGCLSAVLPRGISRFTLNGLLSLIALPAEKPRVPAAYSPQVVVAICSVLEDMIASLLAKRTGDEFSSAALDVFPRYIRALRALGDIVAVVVPKEDMERMVTQSFSELEADFREDGLAAFGADLRDRGIYTMWVLRKISDLGVEIQALGPANGHEDVDGDLAVSYATHALWTRLHLDCLAHSMRHKVAIYPEVAESIVNGLRAAVDAYAWIRQGVDLRKAKLEPDSPEFTWDEEDEALLSDSMRDLGREA